MFSAGVNGVVNVSNNSESTVLQWDQIPNTDHPDCITSYSIGWNGMTYNTTDTATSVTRELLSASGFPFCTTRVIDQFTDILLFRTLVANKWIIISPRIWYHCVALS